MSTRPAVSVVVPFAGDAAALQGALALLRGLDVGPDDELILADNCGIAVPGVADAPGVPGAQDAPEVPEVGGVPAVQDAPEVPGIGGSPAVTVVRASGERSPAHARNAGAAAARREWLLFLDADTVAPGDLLERFFAAPVDPRVGAIAGEIAGFVERPTLAARFGASRNFLSQANHLTNPFKPRAAAAVLLVRRDAFLGVGGFAEGVRAAEDTDFSWRLQDAGWILDFRPEAVVGHRYRESLGELRRQWRGYAAGARWLETRWPGYHPDPGLNRLVRILLRRVGIGPGVQARAASHLPAGRAALSRLERLKFLAVQILLGIEEQIGLRQSNDAR